MYLSQHLEVELFSNIINIQDSFSLFDADHDTFLSLKKGELTLYHKETKETFSFLAGNVVFVPAGENCTCTAIEDNLLYVLSVDKHFLPSILEPGQSLTLYPNHRHLVRNSDELSLIISQLCINCFKENNTYRMFSLLNELADLLRSKYIQFTQPESANLSSRITQMRLRHIQEYLEAHYPQQLSLNELAEELYLTPQYLSRFIKKHLGATFSQYLTQIRLQHALRRLQGSSDSVISIALNCGFPNISAFNRAFRDVYHTSPNAYRNQYLTQNNAPASSPIRTEELDRVHGDETLPLIHTHFGTPTAYAKPWGDTINIGALTNALKVSFHDIFLMSRKQLAIKYVRFHNLFSPEIIHLDELTNEYEFSTLDEILDFFQEAEVYPFVELSSKPGHNSTTAMPVENPDAARLLEAILLHVIQRYGSAYVSNWRFELWCPHSAKLLYPEDFSSYFKQYKSYQKIIKNLLPRCAIGGCGFNMSSQISEYQRFLDACTQEGITFDFLSFSGYSHSISPQVDELISPNPDHILETFRSCRRLVQNSIYRNTPIYITELTSSVVFKNYSLASVFQAAFLCYNMLQFIDGCDCVAYLGYWDDSEKDAMTMQRFYPRFGFLDRTGIAKPAFFAYAFLSRLGRNLVSLNDNYILTCNSNNRFQLLIFNYIHFNDEYCLNPLAPVPLERTYEMFENGESKSWHFKCDTFPSGRYKVVKHAISRDHGSILDEYIRIAQRTNTSETDMHRMIINMNEEECSYYRQVVLPKMELSYLDITDSLNLDITLSPHEVAFFEFVRIS